MSDIEQLQQRITAAMDRVAYGVSRLEAGAPGEIAALKAALDEEKTVTAQLEERVAALKHKLETEAATAAAATEGLRDKMAALDLEMQTLRGANDALREANAALREANASGLADADLINAGMAAELAALQAARDVERAEADAILTALAPALQDQEEASNA